MIARVFPTGKGFKGTIAYQETGKGGLQRKEDRVEWEWFRNLPTRDSEVAACMMAATANAANKGTTEAVYHFSVSLDPDDPVGPGTMRRIAERTIRDLGLEEYEAVVYCHKDRPHPHLHVVVNRVHPERLTVWKPWRDFYRLERSMRAQERELGLRVVPGYLAPAFAPDPAIKGLWWERVLTPAQLRPQPGPKRGDDAFLRDVTERATAVLQRVNSWAEFQRGLAEKGLSIRVKGGGFRVTDGRHDVKASEVAREFSRKHLEKRFGPYPDYRARMAVAESTLMLRSSVDVVAPQPRAREPRRAQFGDAGHGIAELFGSPEPRERDRPDAVQRSRAADGPKHALAPVIGAPANRPRPPALPASLPAPVSITATDDVQRAVRAVRRPQFGDAGQGISELFGSVQEPEHREAEPADALPSVEATQQPAHSAIVTEAPGHSRVRIQRAVRIDRRPNCRGPRRQR